MANYIAEVAKLLDVEVGETFSINQTSPLTIFRFTDKCLQTSTGSDIWVTANSATLYQLLNGRLSIHKLPWKPTKGEKYYVPHILDRDLWDCYSWDDEEYDEELYKRGVVFKTKEEAVMAAKKMLEIARKLLVAGRRQ